MSEETIMNWRLDRGQIEVVDDVIAPILRAKTSAERVAMISDAHDTAWQLIWAAVHRQHANWTDDQIHREVARRLTRAPG